MEVEVGSIVEGKVTGITKFGAFVRLPDGSSGLVHISEIANAFVSDVNDYLHLGDPVRVKIISVNEAGKINLSIKQVETPDVPKPSRPAQQSRPVTQTRPTSGFRPPDQDREVLGPSNDASFEDKLKRFMQVSDSKVSDSKLYADRKGGGRRRK